MAKWLCVCLRTKWFWVRVQLQSFRFLLCVIDVYTKYAWVFPWKDKMAPQKNFDKLNHKPNKLWEVNFTIVRKNGTEMYSAHNKGKSVIAERLKLKKLCRGHMLLMILMEKKLLERFTKTNRKKQIKKSFQVIKLKVDKFYVKWKGYSNLFNSWMDKNT